MIEITNTQIDRVNLLLGGLKSAPSKVFANVINRGLSTIHAQSAKEIRQTYKIKDKDLKSAQNIAVTRASGGNLIGQIRYAGTMIPLIKFDVTPTQPRQKAVAVSVLQNGSGKRLLHAYVANLGRHGVGVFERESTRRASSKQLYGPSPAHMVQNDGVLAKVEAAAMETIDKRVEHEIMRILNGYG